MKLLERIESVYNMGGIKGLCFIGKDYLLNRSLPDRVKNLPRSIQIEPTSRCNLSCRMCYYNVEQRKNSRMLKLDDFRRIISDNFDYYHILRLWGIGEPLMNPDIYAMIAFEKDRGNSVNISTNGILLTEENVSRLIDSGIDKINISIDSTAKDEYEYIRRGASYDILRANLDTLSALRSRTGSSVKVSVTTVVMRSNINRLGDFVSFLRDYGISRLAVQQVQLNRPGVELDMDESLEEVMGLTEKFAELDRNFRKNGIKLSVPEIRYEPVHKNCLWPWLETYIACNGDVTPCCRNNDDTYYVCGNIFKENFKDIWNNEKYRRFRGYLRDNDLPELCRDCTML